jgi:cyclophilin family peptidyl-prolyl cis-trans isomerase
MQELNMLAQRSGFTPSEKQVEAYTTVGGTPHLDGAYTVFGEVIEGLDVLDAIAASPTDAYDRPLEDVIYSISILE